MAEADAIGRDGASGAASNTINGGVFFHAVIQGRDITVQLPPQITPALSALPPASGTFTGREEQVERLLEGLAPGREQRKAPLIAAVAGMAGVGKTELVVQTATRALKEPGWFPGGVLFVDMFGYDSERRLPPDHALDGLLRALGMPGEHIPDGLQDRTRLYRSVLAAFAEQGRRILVVIDNASDEEQAHPLLPTDGTNAALLTSRHTLDVDARLHDLDVLDVGSSIELLNQALHNALGPGDTRVQDEPEHAKAIARLCAGLPLALRIATALLADAPKRPLASLALALEAEHRRLDRLRREERAVRAAFDLSHQHLGGQQARLFRLLSLNPGDDLSTETAANLAGDDLYEVEGLLQDLARAHLLEPAHVWGRWRFHDLVRLYADEKGRLHADSDERNVARSRLFAYYQTTAEAASSHLDTGRGTPSACFPDRDGALAWLDAERPNLVATVTAAPRFGLQKTSFDLADALTRYLHDCYAFDDWVTVTTTALAICREFGDRSGEAVALNQLGLAFAGLRRFGEAIDAHDKAAIVYRGLGDRDGEAGALTNLGSALTELRRFDDAITAHTQAVAIFRETGDGQREGHALSNLGITLNELRRFDDALNAYTRAATIFNKTGNRQDAAHALNNAGGVLTELRQFERAIEFHAAAATILRTHGDRHGEALAFNNLGRALVGLRRFDQAINAHAKAAAIYREVGDRHREAIALNNHGLALVEVGRFGEAIDAHTQAAAIFRETSDRHGESQALNNLGRPLGETGRLSEAIDAHTQAAAIYRDLGDRHREGLALHNLGATLSKAGRFKKAIVVQTKALTIFRKTGDRHREGLALHNLSNALLARGRFKKAIDARTKALTIFRETGNHP
ncbi:tetratricopeptide repeat protein [Streptomyces sp. NPDC059426]|uniref:tetratricopeptide repeat protein n=1 Tax=Streptomyces sp. NPDC059426 TaxID=3346827 RepID=UPI0036B1FB97